ncbi:hypothetical protein [Pantanalinema sp. GBBB05]|uniref:hypothetical protein n=1 Tax=Pantanalinema sp. GBBB05 TaxID=2604139 RepID=UPI001DA99C68|nr:hypothetical protein [Pantanalinema sp. GBBB05]
MLNTYPVGSEHEYLAWLVSDRYYQEKVNCDANQEQLLEQRWRGEEIIYRLYLDSRLRLEGLNLPDVWERTDELIDEKFAPLEKKLEGF